MHRELKKVVTAPANARDVRPCENTEPMIGLPPREEDPPVAARISRRGDALTPCSPSTLTFSSWEGSLPPPRLRGGSRQSRASAAGAAAGAAATGANHARHNSRRHGACAGAVGAVGRPGRRRSAQRAQRAPQRAHRELKYLDSISRRASSCPLSFCLSLSNNQHRRPMHAWTQSMHFNPCAMVGAHW